MHDPKNVGSIYGLMLTAWGFGSIPGPLITANIRQTTGSYSPALYLLGGLMLVSAVTPFIVRSPRPQLIAQPAKEVEDRRAA